MKTYEVKLKLNIASEEEDVREKVDKIINSIFTNNDFLLKAVTSETHESSIPFIEKEYIKSKALDFIYDLHDNANLEYEQIKYCISSYWCSEQSYIAYIEIYENNVTVIKIVHVVCGGSFETETGWYCDGLRFIINEYKKGAYNKYKEFITKYIDSFKDSNLPITCRVH